MDVLFLWVSEIDLKYFVRDARSIEYSTIYRSLQDNEDIKFDKIILLHTPNIEDSLKEYYEDVEENETRQTITSLMHYYISLDKYYSENNTHLTEAFIHSYIIYLDKIIYRNLISYGSTSFEQSEMKQHTWNSAFGEYLCDLKYNFCGIDINEDTKRIIKDLEKSINAKFSETNNYYFYLDDTSSNSLRDFTNSLIYQTFKNIYFFRSLNNKGLFLTPNKDLYEIADNDTAPEKRRLSKLSLSYLYYHNEDTVPDSFKEIITVNTQLISTIKDCNIASQTDEPILLLGETGTGKELFARGIHKASSRSNKEFVAINCGAIPRDFLESELFGYVKGAFTGAVAEKPGLFETVQNGTIFLDEIGELPMELQSKLLRVLQERVFRRIGSVKEIPFKARVVSATNTSLTSNFGISFRSDLYYRINTYIFKILPLRKRGKEDTELLTEYFLNKFNKNQENHYVINIKDNAKQLLFKYDWPGNVRQFESNFKRAYNLALQNGKDIDEDIIKSVLDFESLLVDASDKESLNENKIPQEINANLNLYKVKIGENINLKKLIEEIERDYITEALKKTRTQKSAGMLLGYSQQLILNKIKKYKIGV